MRARSTRSWRAVDRPTPTTASRSSLVSLIADAISSRRHYAGAPSRRTGPDEDPCDVRGRRGGTPRAARGAHGVSRHTPASAHGRLLHVGGHRARPHAGTQPRDQGARLCAPPGGRTAQRAARRRHPPLDNTRAERALRKIVIGRKNWLFYGTDTHAEAAAAIFSIIATCRLHGIDPFVYFDEVLRVLPYWPQDRYLEFAPQHWRTTRARLDPVELERPLSHITVPLTSSASTETRTQDG